MKKILFLICLVSLSAYSASSSQFMVEPIYGMETALVRYPEPARYKTRAMYGARAIYGATFLSGELEVSQAKSRDDYPSINQKVEDTSDRAAVGIRSTLPMSEYAAVYFRAGGRASQGKSIVTTDGVSEEKDNPLRVDPYGGAGLQLAFASNFALNAGVTLVRNSENEYDSQYTLGLTTKFGSQ